MKIKKLIFRFLFVVFIGLIIGIVCLNVSYFNIGEVEVHGNKKLDADYVKKISGIYLGENIFKINSKNIEQLMKKQNQYIKEVDINRKLPSKVIIKIKERKTEAFLQLNDQLIDIDKKAIVLRILDYNHEEEVYKPIVSGLDFNNISIGDIIKFKSLKAFKLSLRIISILKRFGYNNKITEINMSDLENIRLKDSFGKKINLGNTENLTYKLRFLEAILNKCGKDEKGTIDFNYKKPIFIPGN